MKCVCGYEYMNDYELHRESDWGNDKDARASLEARNGDDPFVLLVGPFTKQDDVRIEHVSIFACPKCKTLRMGE